MIQVTINFQSTLKDIFGQEDLIMSVSENTTVCEVLNEIIGRFKEGLEKKYGVKDVDALLKYHILLMNGKHVSRINNLGDKLKKKDYIRILQTIAGG